jgi:hypothetical protein
MHKTGIDQLLFQQRTVTVPSRSASSADLSLRVLSNWHDRLCERRDLYIQRPH